MKKILTSTLMIVSIFILMSCADNSPSQEISNVLTATEKGIDLTIENIVYENDITNMNLTFSNHVYDISSMDIFDFSSLNGVAPTSYVINDTKMGGHHVEAEIQFPTKPNGSLIIGLNEEITFTFEL